MKYFLGCLAAVVLLSQCQQPAAEEDVDPSSIQLITEELVYYPLSEIDSVYSVQIKLSSADSVVVKYKVTLTQQLETFSDSLVLDIAAGEAVTGQIIFPDCRVKNRSKPSMNSKITILEN